MYIDYTVNCLDSSFDLDTPVITLAPANSTINEERTLTLTYNASGSESIEYNWFLPNKTNIISNILQINNINRREAGNYNCTASSTADNKTLTVFNNTTITVFCKCTIDMFCISKQYKELIQ